MSALRVILWVVFLSFGGCLCLSPAQGGVLTAAAKTTFELIARKAAKETTEESAKNVALRLLKESGDVAAKSLLKRYGDDAARIICKPERIKLLDTLGDDAAAAMVKHGSMAERLLIKGPEKETARFLAAADKQTVRQTEILLRHCNPKQKESAGILRFIARHPGVVAYPTVIAGGLCGSYVWAQNHPGPYSVIKNSVEWVTEHPWLTAVALLVSVTLVCILWRVFIAWVKHLFLRLLKYCWKKIRGLWQRKSSIPSAEKTDNKESPTLPSENS